MMGDDFMVKDLNSGNVRESMLRGTPAYQAPTAADEQARQRALAENPMAVQVEFSGIHDCMSSSCVMCSNKRGTLHGLMARTDRTRSAGIALPNAHSFVLGLDDSFAHWVNIICHWGNSVFVGCRLLKQTQQSMPGCSAS